MVDRQREIARDRKEAGGRGPARTGPVRMGPDMGPEGAAARREGRDGREGRAPQLETPKAAPPRTGEGPGRAGEGREEGKVGGVKRHATRSTPGSSGTSTPAKRRVVK